MRHISAFFLAVALFLTACHSNRRSATTGIQTYTTQPASSLIPVGFYYDYATRVNQGHLTDTSHLSVHQYRLLSSNKDWKRPTVAPTIDFVDNLGHRWTNESLRGRVIVLNYWSPICKPCRDEMPWLSALRDSFPEVNFIGICPADEKTSRELVKKHGFNWPQIVADSAHTARLPRQTYYPTTIIIDANGYVRSFNVGGRTTDKKRISDSLRAVVSTPPLQSPRKYQDLHYEEEYYNGEE